MLRDETSPVFFLYTPFSILSFFPIPLIFNGSLRKMLERRGRKVCIIIVMCFLSCDCQLMEWVMKVTPITCSPPAEGVGEVECVETVF